MIGYVYLIEEKRTLTGSGIYWSVTFVIALVCILTWIVTAHDDALPALFVDQIHIAPSGRHATSVAFLVSVVALAVLWRRRKSVLDLWLIVFTLRIGGRPCDDYLRSPESLQSGVLRTARVFDGRFDHCVECAACGSDGALCAAC